MRYLPECCPGYVPEYAQVVQIDNRKYKIIIMMKHVQKFNRQRRKYTIPR